jgi:predicted metalloprotease
MSRMFALLLAAWMAVGAAAPTHAQSTADAILGDLNSFWGAQFAVAARDYWMPSISILGEPEYTACGWLGSDYGPGAYCTANATLYYAPVWYLEFENSGHDFAQLTVLSHEWGHHVQLLLGINWSADKNYELQADCLSGVYARHAEEQGLAPAGALADSVRLAALSGDGRVLPQDAPEHGSGAERVIAFMNGYEGGIGGCGIIL